MIEISLTQALTIYSAVLGLTAAGIWLYTELSIRRPQRLLGRQFLQVLGEHAAVERG